MQCSKQINLATIIIGLFWTIFLSNFNVFDLCAPAGRLLAAASFEKCFHVTIISHNSFVEANGSCAEGSGSTISENIPLCNFKIDSYFP